MRTLLLFVAVAFLGGCPDKKPKNPTCASDKECKDTEKCIDKKCVKRCTGDKDCPAGKSCKDGACEPIPGWCSGDGDCPNGGVCKNNRCEACKSNDECGEGGKCIDGGCLRKGQCKEDSDCADDEDCVKGVCTKGGGADGDTPKCQLEEIYFGYDQYTLDDKAKETLEKNLACLSSTTKDVNVIGTTDSRGPDEYNIGLSDDRAQAVITYLTRMGVEASRLHKVPLGEGEATGTDDAGYAKDRKVKFAWQ